MGSTLQVHILSALIVHKRSNAYQVFLTHWRPGTKILSWCFWACVSLKEEKHIIQVQLKEREVGFTGSRGQGSQCWMPTNWEAHRSLSPCPLHSNTHIQCFYSTGHLLALCVCVEVCVWG